MGAFPVEETQYLVDIEGEAHGGGDPAEQGHLAVRSDVDEGGELIFEGEEDGVAAPRQGGQARGVVDTFRRSQQEAVKVPGAHLCYDFFFSHSRSRYMMRHGYTDPS